MLQNRFKGVFDPQINDDAWNTPDTPGVHGEMRFSVSQTSIFGSGSSKQSSGRRVGWPQVGFVEIRVI